MKRIKLYGIICKRNDMSYEEQVEQACLGGVDALQFRDPSLSVREILTICPPLMEICRKHKVLFILNDRADLALALNADGVHLGADDLPVEWARNILGPGRIVGRSTLSLAQAIAAVEAGADYIAVGPIFSTPEGSQGESNGIDVVRMVKKRVKKPVIAFGGISAANVAEVIRTGADGVMLGRAVCGAASVQDSAKQLKSIIQKAEAERKALEQTNDLDQ